MDLFWKILILLLPTCQALNCWNIEKDPFKYNTAQVYIFHSYEIFGKQLNNFTAKIMESLNTDCLKMVSYESEARESDENNYLVTNIGGAFYTGWYKTETQYNEKFQTLCGISQSFKYFEIYLKTDNPKDSLILYGCDLSDGSPIKSLVHEVSNLKDRLATSEWKSSIGEIIPFMIMNDTSQGFCTCSNSEDYKHNCLMDLDILTFLVDINKDSQNWQFFAVVITFTCIYALFMKFYFTIMN